MAKAWTQTTIGELITKHGGSIKTGPFGTTLKAAEYSREGVPLISVGEIGYGTITIHESTPRVSPKVTERLSVYLLEEGDIVFGRKGAVDRSAIVQPEQSGWFLGSDGIRLRLPRDGKECDARFLSYCLQEKSHRAWILSHATGTTMPSLNQGVIERIPIPLPPLPIQRAIARLLGTMDEKIKGNRRIARTLEAMAMALFESWFVRFEYGARERRHVTEPTPVLPEGWRVGTLGDIAEVNARTLSRLDDLPFIDYIEISEVMRGEVNVVTRYARGTEPSRARRRLRHGDTVMSTVRPDRGAHFLCLDPSPSLIASTGFAVLSAKDADWAFVYVAATNPAVGVLLGRLADGGAYPAVRAEAIANVPIALPNDMTLRRVFHNIAAPLLQRAEICRRQTATLAAMRDALLPKLISGEISVPTPESINQGGD
jgi:type I restriction enzyme S subunit